MLDVFGDFNAGNTRITQSWISNYLLIFISNNKNYEESWFSSSKFRRVYFKKTFFKILCTATKYDPFVPGRLTCFVPYFDKLRYSWLAHELSVQYSFKIYVRGLYNKQARYEKVAFSNFLKWFWKRKKFKKLKIRIFVDF